MSQIAIWQPILAVYAFCPALVPISIAIVSSYDAIWPATPEWAPILHKAAVMPSSKLLLEWVDICNG